MANFKVTLTASNIKYLLAMYKLSSDNSGMRSVRIAELLEISKPSVHKMVNTLQDMKLVTKNPYGEILFTEEGFKLASRYNKYYKFVSGLFFPYISDGLDIRSVSCAVLAEIPDEGLARMYEIKQINGESKCIGQH